MDKEPTTVEQEVVARWCGFEYDPSPCQCALCKPRCWIAPDAKVLTGGYREHCTLPDFLSLDVLFKYAIELKGLEYRLQRVIKGHSSIVSNYELEASAEHEHAGHALFWAIYSIAKEDEK